MSSPVAQPTSNRPKLLVLEFWGLGDLTFATPLLRAAQKRYDITLVGKAHAAQLLQPSFPEIHFIHFDAPWSAYRGKYALWRWNWRELFGLFLRLRRQRFDAAVSVRNDPRDHLFMLLAGAQTRYGFPIRGSDAFLTHPLTRTHPEQHKVEDWADIGRALELSGIEHVGPRLEHARYRSPIVDAAFAGVSKPMICLHPGARLPVRRWREENFVYIVQRLREQFDFHLVLIPDPDGYGSALKPLADTCLPQLGVADLVDVLGRMEFLLSNDSGPSHITAACGRPSVVAFGPTNPAWFRPWGNEHYLIIRDICPWRPCFDYCKFSEPYCMTKLAPEREWPGVLQHLEKLLADRTISPKLRRGAT